MTLEIVKRECDRTNFSAVLAAAVEKFYSRFLSLPGPAKALLPIWTMHSHIFDEFNYTPYLNIKSPEPGCGKTTVGDVLSSLCCRATSPTSGTAAALRRIIAAEHGTLIIDEWDSLHDDVRKACVNFLNTGFKFDGTYPIVQGGEVVYLPTFCPKIVIGRANVKLPEATISRAISFTIHKAHRGEVEKFRDQHREQASLLRQHIGDWAETFRASKVRVAPVFPVEFTEARQEDISEPLLTIADICGGTWPNRVRKALVQLLTVQHAPTPGNEVLRAVRLFRDSIKGGKDFFSSREFCTWANRQEERPWSEKPMTSAKLAGMLREYEIYPIQINRLATRTTTRQKNLRGYLFSQFAQAFERYLDISTEPLGC